MTSRVEINLGSETNTASDLTVTHSQQLAELCEYMIDSRDYLPYLDVARAMVVQAFLMSEDDARKAADGLAISRQTRHNWLKKDLDEWTAAWERRRLAGSPVPVGAIKPKEYRISDDDWMWIAKILSRGILSESWAIKAAMVQSSALKDPARAHLMTISRVTLWRARVRISGLMEQAEKESASMVRLLSEEFIEQEAAVLPLAIERSDGFLVIQETGNPF